MSNIIKTIGYIEYYIRIYIKNTLYSILNIVHKVKLSLFY
jgi:hypothetical protein